MESPRSNLSSPTAEGGSTGPSRRFSAALCLAGIVYILPIFFRDWLFAVFLPTAESRSSEHATVVFAMLPLPGLIAVLLAGARFPAEFIATLRHWTLRRVGTTLTATVLIATLLNACTLWPYSWRWPASTSLRALDTLHAGGDWGTIWWWIISTSVVIPFVEEYVFRQGLLYAIAGLCRSRSAGVLTSAILFGAGHLGYWPFWHADAQHALNAFWVTGMGLVLGAATVRTKGDMAIAVVAHGTRNAMEFVSMALTQLS